jgi:hypothetical protein
MDLSEGGHDADSDSTLEAEAVGELSESDRSRQVFFISKKKNVRYASVADPGCLSRIPDPNFFHPGSRSKNLSILTQKDGF